MPNAASNSSQADPSNPAGGYGTAAGTKTVYNPRTGTWDTVPTGGTVTDVKQVQDPRAWGGYAPSVGPDGKPLAGTSGADQDIQRYGQMADAQQPGAPVIDQTQSNETRGFQVGSLGILQDAAGGGSMSPAAKLVYDQAHASGAAGQSLAAGVRGGAGARAAAARAATNAGSTALLRANKESAAMQAGSMANARGQYANAAAGLRGADLGLATDQAKLQAGQNAANDQRQQHYDGQAWNVANANNNANLNVSAQDAAAAAQQRASSQATAAADRAVAKQATSAVTGGLIGGAQGAIVAQAGAPPATPEPDPYSKKNTGSDERMKYGAKPVKAKKKAAEQKAEGYDGKYLPGPFAASEKLDVISGADRKAEPPQDLHGAIEKQIAQDERDYPKPTYGYFDEDNTGSIDPTALRMSPAPKGYAASRAGQAGYMFGPDNAGPMTADQRDVMMSDASAKREAYLLGRAHEMEGNRTGKPVDWAYGGRPKEGEDIVDKDPSKAAAKPREMQSFQREAAKPQVAAALPAPPPGALRRGMAALAATPGVVGGPFAGIDAVPAAARAGLTSGQGLGVVSPQEAAPVDTALSDERSKTDGGDAGDMAAANRSMAPFSYKYKSEYAGPEGQRDGEENIGPMAQNMAADPIARTAIVEREDGMLGIDKDKALKLTMGGLADLEARFDAMKKRSK